MKGFAFEASPILSYSTGVDKYYLSLMRKSIEGLKQCDWVISEYYARKTGDLDLLNLISSLKDVHLSTKKPSLNALTYDMLSSYLFANCKVNVDSLSNINKKLAKNTQNNKDKENNDVITLLNGKSKISEAQILRIMEVAQSDFNIANRFFAWCYKEPSSRLHYSVELFKVLSNNIRYQQKIVDHKMRLIREVLYSKRCELYNDIYELSLDHSYKEGVLFAESEWMSGWIAVSFLKNKDLAIQHFTRLFYSVKTPVSIARASYWLGRVYEIYGDTTLSKKWYKISAYYGKTFHGQVATYKLQSEYKLNIDVGNKNDINIFDISSISYDKKKELDLYLKYTYIMALLNETKIVAFCIDKLLSSYEGMLYSRQSLIDIARISGMPYISLYSSKYIERKYGIVEAVHSFPILYQDYIESVDLKNPILVPLCYGLMRQESEFNILAVSHAGAIGLMQLTPNTANEVITRLGLNTKYINLLNPKHSIIIGGNLLSHLMDKYDNSIVLSVAAYNAGETAVDRWIKNIGDIRGINNIDDCIEWIENVPYKETRQYIFRVLENARVYEKLLNNSNDLERSIYDFVVVPKCNAK